MDNKKRSPVKIEPAVMQIINQINVLFTEAFGPIGLDLAQPVFAQWIDAGRIGTSGLRHYIKALGDQFDNAADKENFIARAERLLLRLQMS